MSEPYDPSDEPADQQVYEALWDAYIAATYCLNRYRHCHAGRPVRDLDEAEAALSKRKDALVKLCADKTIERAKRGPYRPQAFNRRRGR